MTAFAVRRATLDDAAAAVAVIRASISELCVADHRGDPATLARWLLNKTPEHFAAWLANTDIYIVVAEEAAEVSGIAALKRSGELNLCYVAPDRQHRGLGRALLLELESQAARWNLSEIRLGSTAEARAFYARHGYTPAGSPRTAFGVVIEYPYAKKIA